MERRGTEEDAGMEKAKVILQLWNFTPSNELQVSYPDDVNGSLVITVDGATIYNYRLPAAIDVAKSRKKRVRRVYDGSNGKVVVKLYKVKPDLWGTAWNTVHSPSQSTSLQALP